MMNLNLTTVSFISWLNEFAKKTEECAVLSLNEYLDSIGKEYSADTSHYIVYDRHGNLVLYAESVFETDPYLFSERFSDYIESAKIKQDEYGKWFIEIDSKTDDGPIKICNGSWFAY